MASYIQKNNTIKSQFSKRGTPSTAEITALIQYFRSLPSQPATLADLPNWWAKLKFTPLSAGQLTQIINHVAIAYTRHKDDAFTPTLYNTLQKQMYFWQTAFARTQTHLSNHETHTVIQGFHTLNMTLQDTTLNKLEMAFAYHLPTASVPNMYHAASLFLKNRHVITPRSAQFLESKLSTLSSGLAPLELQKIIALLVNAKAKFSPASHKIINKTLSAANASLNPTLAARFLQDVTKANIPLTPESKKFLEESLVAPTEIQLSLNSALHALRAYNTANGQVDMNLIRTLDDAIASGLANKTDAKSSNYALYVYSQSGFKPSKSVLHTAYKNIGSKISFTPTENVARFLRSFAHFGIVPAAPLLNTIAERIEAEFQTFQYEQNLTTETILAAAILDSIASDPSLKRIARTLSQITLMPKTPVAMRKRMYDACLWFDLPNPVLQQKITSPDSASNNEHRLSNIFAASGIEINSHNVYIPTLGKQTDFAIPRMNVRGYIYVELDGPHHFLKDMDGINTYNGETMFQTRLLEKTNPHDLIVRIPFDHLTAAEQDRTLYQTGKMLDNALNKTRYIGTHRSHVLLYRDNQLKLSKI